MSKTLSYFQIGDSYGGNQDWFHNVMMHRGGCAAATACDSCIYFEKSGMMRGIFPFDTAGLSKADYEAFAMKMKPYLKPRVRGITQTSIFTEGLERYLGDCGQHIDMKSLHGSVPYEEAESFVAGQIDNGYPVPNLLLKHRDQEFKNFTWHWFLLTGYEMDAGDMFVTAATFGCARRLSLRRMWDTGYDKKGGMVEYKISNK